MPVSAGAIDSVSLAAMVAAALAGGLWCWLRSGDEPAENGLPAYPRRVRLLWCLAGAAALASIAAVQGVTLTALEYLALMGLLLTVAITDVARFIIPNRYVVAALAIWAVSFLVRLAAMLATGWAPADALAVAGDLVVEALLGAAITAGPVLVLTLIMGAAGKQAMGGGDIKLLAAVGLFFTWQQDLLALFIACVAAAVMGLVRRARTGHSTMAFGAAIAVGWLAMMVLADEVTLLLWL